MAPCCSAAQKAALNAARLKSDGDNLSAEEKLKIVRAELSAAKISIKRLKFTSGQLVASKRDCQDLYKKLCNECCKSQRAIHIKILSVAAADTAKEDASQAITLLDNTTTENGALKHELSDLLEKCVIERKTTERHINSLTSSLSESRHKFCIYERQHAHIPGIKKTAVKRANKGNKNVNLLQKGVYSPVARQLACVLTKAGCSRQYVRKVISMVCKAAGIEVHGDMSCHTVGHAILEGGVAAGVQLGHELMQAEGFTVSGDSTTNRHVNYDARHINLKVPDYTSDDPKKKKHKNCLVGIRSSGDQSSEQHVAEWIEEFNNFLGLFRQSPLGQRSYQFVCLLDALAKFFGNNSDHCAKEKKSARIMANLKIQANREKLGEDEVGEKTLAEIETVHKEEKLKIIEDVGGQDAWNSLSADTKSQKEAEILKNMLISFGEKEYEKLSDEEKQDLDFVIWAGCRCHKEINTMKYGNIAMMLFWDENGLPGPILLANKDNAAVINNIKDLESLSPAEQRALEVTVRGAVKAASITGYLFNHKDDKKGHQDTYKWWFEKHGIKLSFPDTSSNRYQSYCEAAASMPDHAEEGLIYQ